MTCSSHSDRRGDSGLLVGQVCRSGQRCRAKTRDHGKFWNLSLLAGPSTWTGLVLALPPAVSLQTRSTPATAGGQDQPSESGHTHRPLTHTHTYVYGRVCLFILNILNKLLCHLFLFLSVSFVNCYVLVLIESPLTNAFYSCLFLF